MIHYDSQLSFGRQDSTLDSTLSFGDEDDTNITSSNSSSNNNISHDNNIIASTHMDQGNEENRFLLVKAVRQFSKKLILLEQDLSQTKLRATQAEEKTKLLEVRATKAESKLELVQQAHTQNSSSTLALTDGELEEQRQRQNKQSLPSFVYRSQHHFHPKQDSNLEEEEEEAGLNTDSFTLMMIKRPFSKSWSFALVIFANQSILLALILKDQIESSDSVPFDVPDRVTIGVRIAQILGIFITIATSYDVVLPIKEMTMFWISNRAEWEKVVEDIYNNEDGDSGGDGDCNDSGFHDHENSSTSPPIDHSPSGPPASLWLVHILFPNMIKFLEGLMVMACSFIIIIQSNDVIDLCKDFAAIGLIAELDNVAFYLANLGYFGSQLKKDTETVASIKVKDRAPKICFGLAVRPLVLFGLFVTLFSVFMLVAVKQNNGDFFRLRFPFCDIPTDLIPLVGDGTCHAQMNNYACSFDNDDCTYFNLAFPDCEADPSRITDGQCDLGCDDCRDENGMNIFNNQNCGWDGSDCSMRNKGMKAKWPDCGFESGNPGQLGDGFCHEGLNIEECGFDDGDCT